jgi:hypothetical protein
MTIFLGERGAQRLEALTQRVDELELHIRSVARGLEKEGYGGVARILKEVLDNETERDRLSE